MRKLVVDTSDRETLKATQKAILSEIVSCTYLWNELRFTKTRTRHIRILVNILAKSYKD